MPRPKYQAIAEELGAAIAELPPGAALPSQRELADHHRVTVMTVRQAIARLVESGQVVSAPGRGTFVAPRSLALQLGSLASLAEEAEAAGRELTTTVVDHGPLDGTAGEQVYRIVRLRRLDGLPFALQTSLLPMSVAQGIDPGQLADRALYELLAAAGQEVVEATETVRAVTLDPDQAKALGRTPGSAALLSVRESRTASGEVVVTDRGLIPGDLGVLSISRARLQPAAHGTPDRPTPEASSRRPASPGPSAPGPASPGPSIPNQTAPDRASSEPSSPHQSAPEPSSLEEV